MFRCASLPFPSLHGLKSARFTRYFHRVTTDFIDYDPSGKVASRKVSIIVGNPGETFVLIDPGVGTAIRAASPFTSPSAASAESRCKITFFHDSQHFGFGRSSSCLGFIQPSLTLCSRCQDHRVIPASMFQVTCLVRQSQIQALQLCI